MAITTDNIRDLLNRPRGLNDATITEYITIRTEEITKLSRSTTLYEVSDGITETQKESAIKFLVCVDCLRVLIDTVPSFVPENQQRTSDIRFSSQLRSFEKQAHNLLNQITEAGGTAFAINSSASRVE